MENNEMVVYDRPNVEIREYRDDYKVTVADKEIRLIRGDDFGMITKKDGSPISQKPTLFKSGAHKILTAFGLTYVPEVVDSYKDHKEGYFYYEVKTTAYYNGIPVRAGYGCANTNEKSSGLASPFDTANTKLKMAEKRSEVDLAIKLADASGWFTQDVEDLENEKRATKLQSEDEFINTKQIQRIFAIAQKNGITTEKAKTILAYWGFASTKEIKVKDYDEICDKFKNYKKED